MIVCVIPSYRAADSLVGVVAEALRYVDRAIVVDDCCPQESGLIAEQRFGGDPRVEIMRHSQNRGVGAAMKTGFRRAMALGAEIVVKLDADGQMDPAHIPQMVAILRANARIAMVKGNRFVDGSIARSMPTVRLLGNSALTLIVRAVSGYWNGVDPTNGYFAISTSKLRRLNLEKLADRYFFEISLLSELGLRRYELAEIEIPARYGGEISSLSVSRVALTFPTKLFRVFVRRIVWQYLVSDMNVGSLFMIVGTLLIAVATILGSFWWAQSLETGLPRSPGTAAIVLFPMIMGFQLYLNAVLYDVQSAVRVHKAERDESAVTAAETAPFNVVRNSA